MKNLDRTTKMLLALLVAGVWGLLLRPAFQPTSAQAQSKAKMPSYISRQWVGDRVKNMQSDLNSYAAEGYRVAGYSVTINAADGALFYSAIMVK